MSHSVNYKLDMETIESKMGINKNILKLNMLKKINILPFESKKLSKNLIDNLEIMYKTIFKKIINIETTNFGDYDDILNELLNKVKTEHKQDLKNILKELYFNESNIKVYHPRILFYENEVNRDIDKMASYFVNIFSSNNLKNKLESLIEQEPQHVLDKMILDELPEFQYKKSVEIIEELIIIPQIKEQFIFDFNLISSDEQYFLDNISKLIKYYLFFYTSQVIMNIKSAFMEDIKIYPTHFFFEAEKLTKSRQGYIQGWKMIETKSKNLFAYTNLFQILNQTIENDFKGTFMDIKHKLDNLTIDERKEFDDNINYLNLKIRTINGLDFIELNNKENRFGEYECVDELLRTLCDCKDKGTSTRTRPYEDYEKSIKEIAMIDFLKAKGRIGSNLILTQDWLLFFTRLAIGNNDKIRLNELWIELECRGVFFDKFTKENVIKYYDKINLLEKKSDSGDAQYVRIL